MPSTTLGPGVTSGSTGPTAASFQWQTSLSLSPYGPDVSVLALSLCTPDCLLAPPPGGVFSPCVLLFVFWHCHSVLLVPRVLGLCWLISRWWLKVAVAASSCRWLQLGPGPVLPLPCVKGTGYVRWHTAPVNGIRRWRRRWWQRYRLVRPLLLRLCGS